MKKFMRSAAFGAMVFVAAIIMATPALSTPINLDGVYDPGEGYTYKYSVDFVGKTKKGKGKNGDPSEDVTLTGGELYLYSGEDNDDLYGALILPTDFVDNSYGDNSVGWGDNATSGKDHKLKDLLGSDSAAITIEGNPLYFEYDTYDEGSITKGKAGKKGKKEDPVIVPVGSYKTSLGYNYGKYGSDGIGGVSDLFNDTENSSSPETVGDTYTPSSTDFSDWAFAVIYEFKVDGGAAGIDLASVVFGEINIHASPNKIGDNTAVGVAGDPTFIGGGSPGAAVPEPATILLLGGGLAAFAGRQWRNRRKSDNRG